MLTVSRNTHWKIGVSLALWQIFSCKAKKYCDDLLRRNRPAKRERVEALTG